VVVHGNTLSLEEFSHWYTPAHILGFWDHKLKQKVNRDSALKLKERVSNAPTDEASKENSIVSNANSLSDIKDTPAFGTQLRLF
jgi:hypothetical protein